MRENGRMNYIYIYTIKMKYDEKKKCNEKADINYIYIVIIYI